MQPDTKRCTTCGHPSTEGPWSTRCTACYHGTEGEAGGAVSAQGTTSDPAHEQALRLAADIFMSHLPNNNRATSDADVAATRRIVDRYLEALQREIDRDSARPLSAVDDARIEAAWQQHAATAPQPVTAGGAVSEADVYRFYQAGYRRPALRLDPEYVRRIRAGLEADRAATAPQPAASGVEADDLLARYRAEWARLRPDVDAWMAVAHFIRAPRPSGLAPDDATVGEFARRTLTAYDAREAHAEATRATHLEAAIEARRLAGDPTVALTRSVSALAEQVATLTAERDALRAALVGVRAYATGHHEQQPVWEILHSLTVDIPAQIDAALGSGDVSAPHARPESEWHEDDGPALWWAFPISEPPYAGSPLDEDFPEYVTHWTPIAVPLAPARAVDHG